MVDIKNIVISVFILLMICTIEYFIITEYNIPESNGYSTNQVDSLIDSILIDSYNRECKLKDSIEILNNRIDTVYVNIYKRDVKTKEEISNLPTKSNDGLDSIIFMGTELE